MIPEGWAATTIGQHADVLTGFAFKSAEYTSDPQDVKLLRGDNIAPHRLRWRDAKRFPIGRAAEVVRYQLRTGDFVVAMDRTWLPSGVKIAEVTDVDLPCLLVQRVARLRAKDTLHQGLMKQFFSGHHFDQHVQAVQTETAVPHISPADLRDYPVLLPPLPEQRKIAEILATWDRAIETVEALIANARAQKKALMQSLLTGERRLPGFSEEWPVTSLGQLGETYGGLTGKSKADFGQGRPFITYKNVFDNAVVDPKNVELVTVDKAERQHRIRLGDILFTTSSETPNDVGMSSVVAFEPGDTYLNSFCFGFRPNAVESIVPEFAAHFFRCEEMRTKIAALAQGSTRYNISKGQLLKLRFALPGSNEQQAIAGVLDAAESEIGRLKAQLIALRKEKSALMQQLLTGKRRVKVDEREGA